MGESNEDIKNIDGLSIFQDIFRRADKDDDGAISWKEFTSYFADGIFSEEELRNLFNEIDTKNTNNIDTEELCEYFQLHLGSFQEVFAALEGVHQSVNKAMGYTAQSYGSKPLNDQFITRFIIREISKQLAAVNSVFENANESLEEKARENRGDVIPLLASSAASMYEMSSRQYRRQRSAPAARINPTSVPCSTDADTLKLQKQIDRLEKLTQLLKPQISFFNLSDERVTSESEELNYLTRTSVHVHSRSEQDFRSKLKDYVEALHSHDFCVFVTVRSYEGRPSFVIYELWTSQKQRQKFLYSSIGREYRTAIAQHCNEQESFTSILVPSEWWRS